MYGAVVAVMYGNTYIYISREWMWSSGLGLWT